MTEVGYRHFRETHVRFAFYKISDSYFWRDRNLDIFRKFFHANIMKRRKTSMCVLVLLLLSCQYPLHRDLPQNLQSKHKD